MATKEVSLKELLFQSPPSMKQISEMEEKTVHVVFKYLFRNPRPYLLTFKDPMNRFQGIDSARLCSLAGRYYKYDKSIPGLLKRLQTRVLLYKEKGVLEMKKKNFWFEPKQTETRSVSRLFRFVS